MIVQINLYRRYVLHSWSSVAFNNDRYFTYSLNLQDLETIIESAKHGVIYFSLGSHLPSSRLPKKTIEVLLEAFGKLKQTVLWKLDNPAVIGDNPPKNLHTQTWFPQNELLAHPNVKFFISHGGLLSTTETVYHGKPIIGMYKNEENVVGNMKKHLFQTFLIRYTCIGRSTFEYCNCCTSWLCN